MGELINKFIDRFISGEPFYAGLRSHILDTGLLPNEYLFYYLNKELVLENQKKTPGLRAGSIRELDGELYRNLAKMDGNSLKYYNEYIEKRNCSYMANETGFSRAESEKFSLIDQNEQWGYDAVALSALEALRVGSTDKLVLNIPNGTFCPFLEEKDIIETSCRPQGDSFIPKESMPSLPQKVKDLILQVKKYERAAVRAAGEKNRDLAVEALSMNPLVPQEKAEKLFDALRKAHEPSLDYLK
jgi:6-phospho-beta-glucosidase